MKRRPIPSVEDLFSASRIAKILKRYSLSLKKRYGQNFLINRAILERMISYLSPSSNEVVLEIGPGLGALSFLLYNRVKQLVAVEIDRGFIRILKEMIKEMRIGNIKLVNGDFITIHPKDLKQFGTFTKVISNFPYSVGIRSIVKTLEEFPEVKCIVGTVQKELVERLTAHPGEKNYSAVTVYVQFLARITVEESKLSAYNFYPPPEVTSSIISLIPETHGDFKDQKSRKFFKEIVQACFSNRRKFLINNLSSFLKMMPKERLSDLVSHVASTPRVRAEDLGVNEYLLLVTLLKEELKIDSQIDSHG